jgi:hypothetical protein
MNLKQTVMITLVKKMLLAVGICIPLWTQAQNENDLTQFLYAGPADASKLMNGYLNPVIEGLSYGFNAGWYSTAKAHKSLGFDLGVSINAVFIPSSKNFFDPKSLGLETITDFSSTASNGLAPTIAGPEEETTYTVPTTPNSPDINFNGPQGLDFKQNLKVSGVLAPTAQLGIGVYKNTDIKIRWMPEVESGSTKIKLFGVGLMHDIKQHIPGMKLLPFDLSVLVAYTNIKGSSAMENTFDKPADDQRPQKIDFNMDAWLFQALISKKIAVITFYGGIGYNTIKTTSDVTGSYVIPELQSVLKDPVSLDFKNKSMRLTAGVRLNLGPIYLNGDYTLQEYSTVSVGLGATVR